MTNSEVTVMVRGLKKSGELAGNRAKLVSALRSSADVQTRERVGYLLRDVPARELGDGVVATRLAVVSNFTPAGLDNLLRSRLLEHDIWPAIYMGGFNEYVRELLDRESELYQHDAQLTLCLLDEHVVLDAVDGAWKLTAVSRALDAQYATLEGLARAFEQNSAGTLVVTVPQLSAKTLASVIDYRSKARLAALWRCFQARLLLLVERCSRTVVLETDVLLQAEGVALSDPRLAAHGAMYFSEAMLDALAAEITKVVRAVCGRTKKCLVLDLDNTMWGGVLGDVGKAGIDLSDSVCGKSHKELQRVARGLKEQGVLLAVNSKNDRDRVLDALESHPDMVLGPEDFVAIEANWEPKNLNTQRIAQKLNIGTDSLVFLDDSSFERRLVADTVDGVAVPELPEDAAYYSSILLDGGWFNALALTAEDSQRTTLYRREVQRNELKASLVSFDDYLRQLDIEVSLVHPDAHRIARLAQLAQRTNQFNFTGRRYQSGELEEMASNPRFTVFGIEGGDRFGDYGLVGCLILEKAGARLDEWWIRNYLMSCRVFSRGIEAAVLRHVLETARLQGIRQVFGEFVRTNKNQRFEEFYPAHGFELVESDGGVRLYRHELTSLPDPVNWVNLRFVGEVAA